MISVYAFIQKVSQYLYSQINSCKIFNHDNIMIYIIQLVYNILHYKETPQEFLLTKAAEVNRNFYKEGDPESQGANR